MDGDLSSLPKDFELAFTPEPGSKCAVSFRLFDLPTELWLRICFYAILKPGRAGAVDITRAHGMSSQCDMVRQPAITKTCRLLRHELLPLYYRHHEFEAKHLSGVACIRNWFAAIGAANCKAMGTFTFYAEYEPQFWIDSYKTIGLSVDVTYAEDQRVAQGTHLKCLTVTF